MVAVVVPGSSCLINGFFTEGLLMLDITRVEKCNGQGREHIKFYKLERRSPAMSGVISGKNPFSLH
jgi:hypothetical protein